MGSYYLTSSIIGFETNMNIYKWLTNRKYRFFHKKLKGVQAAIWEHEFKIAKARQLREGIRQDRDHALATVANIDANLKTEKDAEKLKVLESDKAKLLDNAKRYEAQMKMVDNQISGVPAEGENPGENGILDTIKSYAELREMYKDYLTKV